MSRRRLLTEILAPVGVVIGGIVIGGDEVVRALGLGAQGTRAPAGKGPAAPPIPPVSWTCPMHAEVVDDQKGQCPICNMTLVPVRLALVWTCPVHTDLVRQQAGQCPRCRRDLIRVTRALSFTCRVHPKVDVLDPGNCPICKRPLIVKYSIRPHGDHNPKHGGFFMMVSNNWHLEVTHPAASVFRLYIYDNYSKPFAPPGLTARVVETMDRENGKRTEMDIPFKHQPRGVYHEAKVPGLTLPADIAIKVRFEAGDQEYRFDFMFDDYSKEPVPPPPARK